MEINFKFEQYGDSEGEIVIYFHGVPGSPEECLIFDQHAKEYHLDIICFDRFAVEPSVKNEDYYKYLADAIEEKVDGSEVDLVGFSIGCHAAIKTGFYLGKGVRNLHLISAASPLECNDHLGNMAGKMVFTIAMKQPFIFTMLSYWQVLLSKIAPLALYKMLLSSAAGEDQTLSETTEFRDHISSIFSHCFGSNVKGYVREINQYVAPWEDAVLKCSANTYIWHGLNDNWSPVSMAKYLQENIPTHPHLELMDGLSHYSCLYAAAPQICAQIAKA